ncbi:MAG: recombinase family protein [Syntrophales bacterium]|nr:hypothetical protein [Syntrophus sp. (in: bacteria)]
MNGQKGHRLRKIARELNDRRILTARGKVGSWTATAVRNVLGRIGKIEASGGRERDLGPEIINA